MWLFTLCHVMLFWSYVRRLCIIYFLMGTLNSGSLSETVSSAGRTLWGSVEFHMAEQKRPGGKPSPFSYLFADVLFSFIPIHERLVPKPSYVTVKHFLLRIITCICKECPLTANCIYLPERSHLFSALIYFFSLSSKSASLKSVHARLPVSFPSVSSDPQFHRVWFCHK